MWTFPKRSILWLTVVCVLMSGLGTPAVVLAGPGNAIAELKKIERELDQFVGLMKKKKKHHKHKHKHHHKKHHHKHHMQKKGPKPPMGMGGKPTGIPAPPKNMLGKKLGKK